MKRLVIIADNCPAQNKNFYIVRFCAWIVEAGWAEEVVLFFLIKGLVWLGVVGAAIFQIAS